MSPLLASPSLGTARYGFSPSPGGGPSGWGGIDWQPIGGVPVSIGGGLQPPAGVTIPGTPLGAGMCPPGTACAGPSAGNVCLGTCYPVGVGGEPGTPSSDPWDTGVPEGYGPPAPPPQTPAPQGTGTVGLCCPAGYHPNKSGYWLKSGTYVTPKSRCIKNRRKNPLNPRAASAALDRIVKGKKAAAFLGRVTVRKKKA